MKHLKLFQESGESKFEDFTRKYDEYQNIKKEDVDKLELFIKKYVDELNIVDKIKKLKLDDFDKVDFSYYEIFSHIITGDSYNIKNIYYHIDMFIRDIHMNYSTPAIRNSIYDITYELSNEYKTYFDKRLISLFEKNHKEYKSVDLDLINKEVKDACQYILDSEKYNI